MWKWLVSSLWRTVDSNVADVMYAGREFQAREAATRQARVLIVDRLNGGFTRLHRLVPAERRASCQVGWRHKHYFLFRSEILRCYPVQHLERQYGDLVDDALQGVQSVRTDQCIRWLEKPTPYTILFSTKQIRLQTIGEMRCGCRTEAESHDGRACRMPLIGPSWTACRMSDNTRNVQQFQSNVLVEKTASRCNRSDDVKIVPQQRDVQLASTTPTSFNLLMARRNSSVWDALKQRRWNWNVAWFCG